MTASQSIVKLICTTILLIGLFASRVVAQEPAANDIAIPTMDSPAGDAAYLWQLRPLQSLPDPLWIERTGIKKGIKGHTLEAEIFAGPDAAVLKSGFFEPWRSLLAEFKEPIALVDPGRIAGIEKTKPYLIIPAGALHGLSGSEFFKAGLSEYARSGGVIICLSQQDGADLAALPVPGEGTIEAAGWQQDTGPLFRSSLVQGKHPLFAGTKKTLPNIETSGYLIAYPPESQVLLSRPDGFPTLIIYPYGAGWVVVSTMFSDFSYGYGYLEAEEKVLLRDIIGWAKSPARIAQTSPDEKLNITLSVQGPELGEASAVKILMVGPDVTNIREIETYKISLKADQSFPLAIPFTVSTDMQPGLYHIEYQLLDAEGQALGVQTESDAPGFSIGQPKAAAPVPRSRQPIAAIPASFNVQSSVDRSGGSIRLNLRIIPDSRSPAGQKQTYYVRVLSQEKYFTPGSDPVSLSLAFSKEMAGYRIPFTLYHSGGRSLARGSESLDGPAESGVALDKQPYFAGQNVHAVVTVPGSGVFTLMSPGHVENKAITGNGNVQFTLPADVPSGTYRLRWNFYPREGQTKQGEVPIAVNGYRVRVRDMAIKHIIDHGEYTSIARVRIHATRKQPAHLKLWLSGPDGTVIPVADNAVTLLEGNQEIPYTFTMKPETAGIWQLHSSVSVTMPEGTGLSRGPLTIATGQMLFDVGESALLGISSDKPVYYDPSGPATLTAYLFVKGKARIELFLNDKKIEKGTVDREGLSAYPFSVPRAQPGTNALKAVLDLDRLKSSAENTFVYGGRLPDLIVIVRPLEPAAGVMPVSVTVKNQGKSVSGPSRAVLYEGDPEHGGKSIARIEVPSLGPNAEHGAIIEWPLYKKTGTRTLTAVADVKKAITESSTDNNTASAQVTIPGLLLSTTVEKKSFNANEPVTISLTATNLTADAFKDVGVTIDLIDQTGRPLSAETVTLPALAAGKTQKMDRTITPPVLPAGGYQVRAQSPQNKELALSSSGITILPTLMLNGSIEMTPPAAVLCMPLNVRYTLKNAGNLTPSSGTLAVEIKHAGTGAAVYTRQLPFTIDTKSIRIDRVDFQPGEYVVALKAAATNKEYGITREFMIAEHPLRASSPVDLKKGTAVIPRVLVWMGGTGSAVRQALAEKIVQQAFDDDDIFVTIVDQRDDFMSKFLGGAYNTAVLFESDEPFEQSGWLKDLIARGNGLVIIGAGDRTRALAEDFGFRFSESPSTTGAMIQFPEGQGLGLSGTVPVRGHFLLPEKNGAKPAALFTGNNRPAVLIDQHTNGRVIVLPFSFTRSALDTGAASLYSLLLRTAAHSAVPQIDVPSGVSSTEIAISASGSPIKSRVVETLPRGSKVIWTNNKGVVKGNVITFEQTAETEQQKLLFLYRAPDDTGTASTEIYYECGGKFVSQGKIE